MSEECQLNINADYDLGLHIGSVFIIALCSFFGTLIPFFFKRYFSTSSIIFQGAKLMGSGVIMSTAFNHMLVASFENLTSPCSGIEFAALAGVCTLMGVLMTLIIQLTASQMLASWASKKEVKHNTEKLKNNSDLTNHYTILVTPQDNKEYFEELLKIEAHSIHNGGKNGIHHVYVDSGHDHSHGGVIAHSDRITAYLLELGIALHSIIIGIALGLARDEFISLFIALVFHQFFEGIGLSSVVAEAEFGKKWIAIGLVAFYTVSTPIGIAIGIGLHDRLNENSQDYVITQGILDGLCAGILIYDAIVNILVPHFNGHTFRHSSFNIQFFQILALVIGSAVMAVIAIWA